MSARWNAVVTYRTAAGPELVGHAIEELVDLHNLIEQGPAWNTIESIVITLVRNHHPGLTVEEALEL